MMDRQLFKETFSTLHASEDTLTEVMDMVREDRYKHTKTRRTARTGLMLALAAALLMGTAFAAVSYHLRSERVGALAAAVSVSADGSAPGAVAFSSGEASDVTFTGLDAEPGWLPEGMALSAGETTKWSFEDNYARGGFSLIYMPLDTGSATFCELVGDAESQENLDINGHEAIYIKLLGDGGFNQRMYVSYPEYNTVLVMYIGADVDHDTAVKFAENLAVSAGTYEMSAENLAYNGRRYLDAANAIETGVYVNTADEEAGTEDAEAIWLERDPARRAVAEDMASAREVGESFPAAFLDFRGTNGVVMTELDVTVTDVSVRPDVSALRDMSYLDPYVAATLDENGRLPKDDYVFVTYGNGITAPGVTVVAELNDQQEYMVAVTLDITNNTDETLRDAVYNAALLSIAQTADGWEVTAPTPADGTTAYDDGHSSGWARLDEMRYYDVRDAESNGGNHIVDLSPGETVTLQIGFVVDECQLGDLWFYMNRIDTDEHLQAGYVDLRDVTVE